MTGHNIILAVYSNSTSTQRIRTVLSMKKGKRNEAEPLRAEIERQLPLKHLKKWSNETVNHNYLQTIWMSSTKEDKITKAEPL